MTAKQSSRAFLLAFTSTDNIIPTKGSRSDHDTPVITDIFGWSPVLTCQPLIRLMPELPQ